MPFLLGSLLTTLFGFFAQYFTKRVATVALWLTFFTSIYAILLTAKAAIVVSLGSVPIVGEIVENVSCGLPANAVFGIATLFTARAVVSGYNYLREIGRPLLGS